MNLLITGGTGFLGSHLIPHFLARGGVRRLVIYSRDEYKQAQVRERWGGETRLRCVLGDVRDERRLYMACWGIDTIIHAAALKRVESGVYDPDEVYKTNVEGTRHVLSAALDARVRRVLLISTDKACYPINEYGFTKALAERLVVGWNVYEYPHGLVSAVVRYGNVLGSRGSVMEVWQQQRAAGQPLQVTDPDATRFLLTPPRALAVIDAALRRMEGGEIFVPDGLRSATLGALVQVLHPGIPIQYTGLRGGEKLHETLITAEENARCWWDEEMGVIYPESHPWRAEFPHRGIQVAPRPGCTWPSVTSQTTTQLPEKLGATLRAFT